MLLTMTIWGSTFVVTKEVIAQLPPFTLAFARVAIGAAVLAPFAWVRRTREPKPWGALFALGFIGVAFYYLAFNLALTYTSAVQGALVQSSIPAMTALIALLWLRERATLVRWAGLGLSMIGVLVVFSGSVADGADGALFGNVLMFATVVAWGVYTSLVKRVAHLDAVFVTAGIAAIGALLLAPAAVYELWGGALPSLSSKSWAGLLFLGAMASGLAYLLYNQALQHLDASEAGAYTNLIPIVGVIAGVVILKEPLTARAVFGGAIVMLGVWVASRGPAKPIE